MQKIWLGGAKYALTEQQHIEMNAAIADTLPRLQEDKALEWIKENKIERIKPVGFDPTIQPNHPNPFVEELNKGKAIKNPKNEK